MASYYIKNSGNDNLDGLSDANAWQTISKLNSSTFQPGDIIYFAKGDYWEDSLIFPSSGTEENPITLTSYGTGGKPLLTSNNANGLSWTDMGSGVFRTDNFLHDEYSLFFEDNVSYSIATSSSCTDGMWYVTWNSTYIYYKPTSGNPSNHSISYSKVIWTNCIYTPSIDLSNKSYIIIDGFDFIAGGIGVCMWNNDTSTPTGITIRNCDFEMFLRAIFLLQGSNNISDVTINNNYFYRCCNSICGYTTDQTSGNEGYEGSSDGYCDNWKIYGNEMNDGGVTDDSGTSWSTGDREAIGFQNIINSEIYDNYIHNGCQTPLIFWDRVGCNSRNNKIYKNNFSNTSEHGTMQGVSFQGQRGFICHEGNNFYCNLLYNCGTVAAIDIVEGTYSSGTINLNSIYNNLIIGNSRPIRILNYFSEDVYFSIKNNIIYGDSYTNTIYIAGLPNYLEIDYNNYYRTSGSHWFTYNGSGTSYANWLTYGFDENSILTDPVFVSGSDYHLQSTSPAIRAGVNVDLDTDYDNVSWNTFPSIGAYEYVNILYIDPSGNDTTGDGSLSTPWKTLYKASTEATWGDTIHVNPGTYTENTTCILRLGVSIVGEGDESIITTTNSTSSWMLLYLVSTNEGTEGNHVFKDLKFDGNDETGCYCFYIRRRGNIEIDNCTFIDWEKSAFNYGNFTSYGTEPTTYATGISIHDSYFYNSSGLSTPGDGWTSQGSISIGGTEGMLIYNNDIILPELDHIRGLPIKAVVGWNKGLKIYNNNILKYCNQTPPSGHPDLPFAIELWDTRGGCEIYNNTILGDVDLVRTSKGDYEFGAKVHHNIMGPETNDVTNPYPGISLEHFQHDVYIYQNHFRNMTSSVSCSSGGGGFPGGDGAVDDYNCVYENVYVYNNLMTNIGAKWVSAEFDASTNIITSTERHRLGTARNRIRLSGDLPAELNTTTLYYVVNPTEYTFQVSLTNGGAAIDFSSNASAYFSHNVYNRACGFGTTTYNCSFQGTTNTVYDSDLFRIKENTAMYLGGTLPAELNSSTLYYAQNVTSTTFQLATSRDGSIIDFTGDTEGTYTPIVIVSGFYFYNNVIEGMLGGLTQSAFFFMLVGTVENFHIKNNIITNMTYTPVWGRTSYCTFDRLEITNNIVYNCGNGNEVVYDYGFDGILTNYVYDPFIEQDPLFISTSNTEPDYHVNEASPAIGAGTYVGLVYDYDGTMWNNPPSIGAYEYGSMVGVRSKVLNYSTI